MDFIQTQQMKLLVKRHIKSTSIHLRNKRPHLINFSARGTSWRGFVVSLRILTGVSLQSMLNDRECTIN